MAHDNPIVVKSKKFAIHTVMLCKWLQENQHEYIMSKQLLRAGTSIGANIHEAEVSMSKAEFISKLNISLKEANETDYWLDLLHETNYISDETFNSIYSDCKEIIRLLTAIIKSSNNNR